MSISRRGTPSRLPIAVAAIGSVGDTTAPSTNASAQERSATPCATTATPAIVSRTSPTASSEIGLQVLPQLAQPREVRRDVEERRQDPDQDDLRRQRHFGTPGPKPISRPPRTSRIGYGIRSGPDEDQERRAGDEQHEELELLMRAELEDQLHAHVSHCLPARVITCPDPSRRQAFATRRRGAGPSPPATAGQGMRDSLNVAALPLRRLPPRGLPSP